MKRVYMIRHGESIANKERRYATPDDKLTKKGITQAHAVAERMKSFALDVIITSPQLRAKDTATIISDTHACKQVVDNDLFIERATPTALYGSPYQDPAAIEIQRVLRENWVINPSKRHSDEENYYDVLSRVKRAVEFLEAHEADQIAVISHNFFMTMLHGYLIAREETTPALLYSSFFFHRQDNTGLTIYEYDTDDHPYAPNGWRLVTWNDQRHLGD